jgi:hypothetical protein
MMKGLCSLDIVTAHVASPITLEVLTFSHENIGRTCIEYRIEATHQHRIQVAVSLAVKGQELEALAETRGLFC